MQTLKQDSVKALVYRAVKAGNTNPSLTQLQTLALAVGDNPSFQWLKRASLNDKIAVKNCVAGLVYGEEPQKVSTNVGAFFGMEGGDEGRIASEGQTRIFTPNPVERTTEDQKDIAKRKLVPQEEKHPLTSDRATRKDAVSEPLKERTDKPFKDILDRGEAHLEEIAKETQPKKAGLAKTAGTETPDQDYKTGYKKNAADFTVLDGCAMRDCKHHTGDAEDDCKRAFISVHNDTTCLFYEPKSKGVEGDLEKYTSRIKRGEAPELVLREAMAAKVGKADKLILSSVNPGDSVMVNQPGGKPAVNMVVNEVGKTSDNYMALTGTDPAGNIMQGQVMLMPAGQSAQISQQTPGAGSY